MIEVALAILAVKCGMEKRTNNTRGAQIATGMGLGLMLGVALNRYGLLENHILEFVFGPLWGMALGTLYGSEETPKKAKDCDKE